MKRPNFFILGAPKCGTTSLASWLSDHPQVYFSPVKEPHHFYSPYRAPITREEYEALFAPAGEQHKAVGEGSVWYLLSGVAAQRILDYQPDAKFIVCLRNPVEMAPSLHAQKMDTGHELVENFEEAWKLSAERSAGQMTGIFGIPEGDPAHMAYQQACGIGTQLEVLLSQVPAERVHIVVLDDIKADPRGVWLKTLAFLGLDDDKRETFDLKNPASGHKSQSFHRFLMRLGMIKRKLGIKKKLGILKGAYAANSVVKKYPAPSAELRQAMLTAFEPEIALLEKRLSRDLSHWRKL